MDILSYLGENWTTLGPEVETHLQIVVVAMAVATVLSLFLGILAARSVRVAGVVLGSDNGRAIVKASDQDIGVIDADTIRRAAQ